jgi:hypothetical protein
MASLRKILELSSAIVYRIILRHGGGGPNESPLPLDITAFNEGAYASDFFMKILRHNKCSVVLSAAKNASPHAMKRSPSVLAVLVGFGLASPLAFGGVTFYTTQGAFDAAADVTLLDDYSSPLITHNTPLPSFVSNGVTYTGFAGSPAGNVFVASPGFSNFGLGVVQPTTSYVVTANGDEDFTADFSTPFDALGFDTYLNGLGTATLKVFDGATLLDTFTYSAFADDEEYLGIVSSDPVTSIRWTSTDGRTLNTGIGNLSVGTAIPDAEKTLWLIGVSLAALGTSRSFRFKRRQSRDFWPIFTRI